MNLCLYYWRGLSEVSPDLLPGLKELGLTVHEKHSLEQILDDAPSEDPTAIVVDASGGEREASGRILELRSAFQLQMLPVMFISYQASSRCEPLERSFQSLIPANLPLKTEALVKAIDLVVKYPETAAEVAEFLRALSSGNWTMVKPEITTPIVELQEEEPRSDRAACETSNQGSASTDRTQFTSRSSKLREAVRWVLEDQDQKILSRIRNFSNPDKPSSSYGGVVFSLARDASHFETEVLLPTERYGSEIAKFLVQLSDKAPWVAAQANRTAFASAVISKSVCLDSGLDAQLRLSGLFLNWGLLRAPLELCCYDLIRYPSNDLHHMICCGFQESAAFLDQTFSGSAGSLIREMLDILAGRPKPIPSDRRRAAEILIGVDFAARACWGKGYWDPQGANRAIRYIRRTSGVFSDREASQALCRLLGEAVTSHITVHNTFVPPQKEQGGTGHRESSASRAGSPKQAESAAGGIGRWSQKVPICDIAPGMLLSAPVIARDGRIVVGANVRLNEEIVLDLWQLAAVRALGSSVHIAICPL